MTKGAKRAQELHGAQGVEKVAEWAEDWGSMLTALAKTTRNKTKQNRTCKKKQIKDNEHGQTSEATAQKEAQFPHSPSHAHTHTSRICKKRKEQTKNRK